MLDGVVLPGMNSTNNPVEVAFRFMLQLAAALALVYIIIGAIRFSTSSGDPQAVASGRRTVVFALVGLVISVIALTITTFIQSTAARVAANPNNPDPFFGTNGIITILIDQLSLAVGVASVIMIIIGAIRFVTSAGQPQSAQAARNTVIYAVVGIVVALIGQALVTLVLSKI